MKSHEQSLADSFHGAMRRRANQQGVHFHPFSLSGQDATTGGDYVITTAASFALVEYKFSTIGLKTEAKKPLRLSLCKALDTNLQMLRRHDRCHFAAWTDLSTSFVRTNVYRQEICTSDVFEGILLGGAKTDKRMSIDSFATGFFSGIYSLSLPEFQIYVNWLMTIAEDDTGLELVAYEESAKELVMRHFSSLNEAQVWLRSRPGPPPKNKARQTA